MSHIVNSCPQSKLEGGAAATALSWSHCHWMAKGIWLVNTLANSNKKSQSNLEKAMSPPLTAENNYATKSPLVTNGCRIFIPKTATSPLTITTPSNTPLPRMTPLTTCKNTCLRSINFIATPITTRTHWPCHYQASWPWEVSCDFVRLLHSFHLHCLNCKCSFAMLQHHHMTDTVKLHWKNYNFRSANITLESPHLRSHQTLWQVCQISNWNITYFKSYCPHRHTQSHIPNQLL